MEKCVLQELDELSNKEEKKLHVQCFVKHDAECIFQGDNSPRLLYVSRQGLDASRHPRIMHAHEDYTEVVLITEGSSNYLIDHRQYAVKKRDLLVSFLSMALAVIEHQGRDLSEREEEEYVLGNRVKHYIDNHFREPLTLQEIADALHVSTYYMAHVFKDMSGYSPMSYLQKRRIGEAQTQLIHTDRSISEIAFSLGYDAQSHFNQQFSRHVGMAPGEFRRQYVVREQGKMIACFHCKRDIDTAE